MTDPRPLGPRSGGRGRLWWVIPVLVVAAGTLTFVAAEAPRWTAHHSVPVAIHIRADAAHKPAPPKLRPHPVKPRHTHRPRPHPTVTVTHVVVPPPAQPTHSPAPVKVVTPKRPVVKTTPTPSRHDDGGKGGGSGSAGGGGDDSHDN
jgi:hypothetical protein